MPILDDLKRALSRANQTDVIRVQFATGRTIEVSAKDLMTALGVRQSPRLRYKVTFPGGINIREAPSRNAKDIGDVNFGQVYEVAADTALKAEDIAWAQLYNEAGWVTIDAKFAVPTNEQIPTASWRLPFSATQRGAGLNAGGWKPEAAEFQKVRNNRVEFVLICAYQPGQAAGTIEPLRQAGCKNFIFRTCTDQPVRSPQEFYQATRTPIAQFVAALGSVQDNQIMIALHNEPNLRDEGCFTAWQDGKGFNDWYKQLFQLYRAEFPRAKLGFPALSPGEDTMHNGQPHRIDENKFLAGCAEAIEMSDWIGVHYYWINTNGSDIRTEAPKAFIKWQKQFPTKRGLLVGTEVGPANIQTVRASREAFLLAYDLFGREGVPVCAWILYHTTSVWENASWVANDVNL
jgi:hypothetical protein